MNSKEAFGVALRIIGLLTVLVALSYLASAVILMFDPQYRPGAHSPLHYLVTGAAFFLIGVYMLRGAPHIVHFAYPDRHSAGCHVKGLTRRCS